MHVRGELNLMPRINKDKVNLMLCSVVLLLVLPVTK